MRAALAIAPAEASAELSPARRAFAEHLKAVDLALSEFDRMRVPLQRLNGERVPARRQLAMAEAALEAIDAQHAEVIKNRAKSGSALSLSAPAGRERAEDALAAARRSCQTLETALRQCELELEEPRRALGALQAATGTFILAIVEEAHTAALERLAKARDAYATAQAEALAIGRLFAVRGHEGAADRIAWLRAGERAAIAFGEQLRAESTVAEVNARVASWSTALAQMGAGDAAASG